MFPNILSRNKYGKIILYFLQYFECDFFLKKNIFHKSLKNRETLITEKDDVLSV